MAITRPLHGLQEVNAHAHADVSVSPSLCDPKHTNKGGGEDPCGRTYLGQISEVAG